MFSSASQDPLPLEGLNHCPSAKKNISKVTKAGLTNFFGYEVNREGSTSQHCLKKFGPTAVCQQVRQGWEDAAGTLLNLILTHLQGSERLCSFSSAFKCIQPFLLDNLADWVFTERPQRVRVNGVCAASSHHCYLSCEETGAAANMWAVSLNLVLSLCLCSAAVMTLITVLWLGN